MPLRLAAVFAAILSIGLSGCVTSRTTAAIVRTDTLFLTGSTTASYGGGTFEVSDTAGLVCSGRYDPFDQSPTIQTTFKCNDGRSGVAEVTRTSDGQAGAGTAYLSDGTRGTIAFGYLAPPLAQEKPAAANPAADAGVVDEVPVPIQGQAEATVLQEQGIANRWKARPIREAYVGTCDCPYDRKSNGALCGGTSAYSRPGGRSPVCYEEASAAQPVPKIEEAPSVGRACAQNGSCYGDISTYTGLPKTVFVRGYTRKDGTYVRSHYRSRR